MMAVIYHFYIMKMFLGEACRGEALDGRCARSYILSCVWIVVPGGVGWENRSGLSQDSTCSHDNNHEEMQESDA